MPMQLSVIVPVYNVASYIRPCLESILRQGLPDDAYEIILVNDGTQDDSFEQIADLMVQHPNIMRIDQENQGLSAARNTGMLHAWGPPSSARCGRRRGRKQRNKPERPAGESCPAGRRFALGQRSEPYGFR